MQTGKVVSGFVIEGSVKICVVYGMSCCGREMIVIGIQRVNKGRGNKVLGLARLNYALDPESKAFKGQGLYDCIEDCWVKKYCLLPLLIDGVDLKVI